MGLFSKKKQMVEYDKVESERQKKIMQEIFNEAVSEGETYQIFLATELSSKYEKGLFLDTNTTTYYYYIFGFREKDKKMFYTSHSHLCRSRLCLRPALPAHSPDVAFHCGADAHVISLYLLHAHT